MELGFGFTSPGTKPFGAICPQLAIAFGAPSVWLRISRAKIFPQMKFRQKKPALNISQPLPLFSKNVQA